MFCQTFLRCPTLKMLSTDESLLSVHLQGNGRWPLKYKGLSGISMELGKMSIFIQMQT